MAGKNRRSKKRLNREVVVRNGEVILYDANGNSKNISTLSVNNLDSSDSESTTKTFLRGRSKYTYGSGSEFDSSLFETKEEADEAHKAIAETIGTLYKEIQDLTDRVEELEEEIKKLLTSPYLEVTPEEVQWIRTDTVVNYLVKSNADWAVK